jgi:diguanylate cyclase (GGDEF)-like protein/PAS domain S-box-containing protein
VTKYPDFVDTNGTLLLIEGEPAVATNLLRALGLPHVDRVGCLSDGLQHLKQPDVVAILVSLLLPDSQGIETFDAIAAAAGRTPILVLCATGDEHTGRLAVERGADDFLPTDHLDSYSVTRAVRSMLDRHAHDTALFMEKERAAVTLNSIGDAVLSTDVAGAVTYLNPVGERMTGWSRADALGRPLAEIFNIVDNTTREPPKNPLARAVRENRTVNIGANCLLIRRDGYECPIEDSASPIHDADGRIIGAVIVFRDVSASREVSTQLSHLAQHDFLTDLPNRMLLYDRLQQAISLARRHAHYVAVLFLDLDRFKQINDSFGHAVGDHLLQAVALRLTGWVRRSDTVARQGGDEFIVVLSELATVDDARIGVARLLVSLAMPYENGARQLRVPASIGVSVYPDDGEDAETLIRHADAAMYHAKANGRHTFAFFKPDMIAEPGERRLTDQRAAAGDSEEVAS